MKARSEEPAKRKTESPGAAAGPALPMQSGGNTILLVTEDRKLHEDLRSLANTHGRMVVRVGGAPGTVAVLQAIRPSAVVVDLDLPNHAAWETADLLLEDSNCPPLILLAGQAIQFDVRTALRAGLLISKDEPSERILRVVQEVWAMPSSQRVERNSLQRVLIRWLRPSEWAESNCPAYRSWGIND